MPPEPNLGNAVVTEGYWGWLFTYTFVAVAALTALTYLHMKPSKIYERNFSWLWKTLKDLREWIKRPLPQVVVRPASPACTFAFA